MPVYLDHNATTLIHEDVLQALGEIFNTKQIGSNEGCRCLRGKQRE